MSADIVYAVAVEGKEKVLADTAEIEKATEHASHAAAAGHAEAGHAADAHGASLEGVTHSLHGMTRALGTVGGEGAREFAHLGGAIGQIAEAVTSGSPVMIGIAAIGLAIGGIAHAVEKVKEAREEEKKAAEEAEKSEQEEIKKTVEAIMEKHKAITMEKVLHEQAEIQARQAAQDELQDLIDQQEELKNHADSQEQAIQTMKTLRINQAKFNADQLKLDELKEQESLDRKKLTHREANEAEADESKDASEKLRAAQKAADESWLAYQKSLQGELLTMGAGAFNAQLEAQNKFNAENRAIIKEANDAEISDRADADAELAYATKILDEDEARVSAAREKRAEKESADLEKVTDATQKKNEAIAETAAKQALAAKQTDIARAADLAYGGATMVTTPIVGALNEQVGKLTELNRENAGEMFKQAKDMPAIIAMKTQAILIGLAQEAGGKAVTTGLDAAKEAGEAIASVAIGDAAGASAHASASAQLAATAAGYAAFSGGTLAAGVGIGLVRPPTSDEKSAGASGGSTSGGSRDVGSSSSSGSSGGVASVTVVNNISAGAVLPQDGRRAARHLYRPLQHQAQDIFAQLGGGG